MENNVIKTPEIPAGSILAERYEITGIIGEGGYGRVYQAKDKRLQDKIWAVKEIYTMKLSEEIDEAKENFSKEAAMLSKLSHKGIPSVVDYFSMNFCHYIVMEYISGITLEEKLSSEKHLYREGEIMPFALEMCDVIEYLHDHSIIFRDFKPQNIIIDNKGNIKLIDFGIARHFKSGQATDTINIGTIGYAAPEQFGKKGGTDQRSDIYSFGVILHYMASGENPQDKEEPFIFTPIREVNQEISEELERIINKCICLPKAGRFESIRELKGRLLDIKKEKKFPIQIAEKKLPEKTDRYTMKILPWGSKITAEQMGNDKFLIDIPANSPNKISLCFSSIMGLFLAGVIPFMGYVICIAMENAFNIIFLIAFLLVILGEIGMISHIIKLLTYIIGKVTFIFDKEELVIKTRWAGIFDKETRYPVSQIRDFRFERKFNRERTAMSGDVLYFYHGITKIEIPIDVSEPEANWLSFELNRITKFLSPKED
jgi:serine/threonine protein kinase